MTDETAPSSFQTLVGESIGEASVCWDELPSGVFNSSRAKELVDEICAAYDKVCAERDEWRDARHCPVHNDNELPREWWIELRASQMFAHDITSDLEAPDDWVKVIERSAYDKVCAERDEWRDEYQNVCKFATQYEQERDQLKAERDEVIENLLLEAKRSQGW